ncbi:MAG: hypothetical protein H6834_05690 [Planctomycetes bacterium]|nr:hypothetical protein [Planctomycetota bacterium]MCB9890885.1 hypothetical protein [Planctomycetota bacterium]
MSATDIALLFLVLAIYFLSSIVKDHLKATGAWNAMAATRMRVAWTFCIVALILVLSDRLL